MLNSRLLDQIPIIVHGIDTLHDDMAALLADYWPHRPRQRERHGARIVAVEPDRHRAALIPVAAVLPVAVLPASRRHACTRVCISCTIRVPLRL